MTLTMVRELVRRFCSRKACHVKSLTQNLIDLAFGGEASSVLSPARTSVFVGKTGRHILDFANRGLRANQRTCTNVGSLYRGWKLLLAWYRAG